MELYEEREVTIEDFFKICEQEGGKYQIDTPVGWKDVGDIIKKKNKECYNLILEDGTELGCSSDHYVMTNNGWEKSENLDVESDAIETRNGDIDLVAKEYLGTKDTFDLEVLSDEHSYYSNNIVSHNTGKSLTAKATSSLFNLPLLRLDFGKLFSSFVGSSEETTRAAIKLAEILAPSILWIDEVEKGLSGTKSSGQTDGGTTARVVGTFLTWMEEKESAVFMFCTANDHSQIPPEFMRRFDEVFFVDLPNLSERFQIYKVLLNKYNRNYEKYGLDLMILSEKSDGYSGSEIEKSINSALHTCYNDGKRDIKTEDIIYSLNSFNPLYKIREEEFSDMRAWAKKTRRFANSKLSLDGNKKEVKYGNIDL